MEGSLRFVFEVGNSRIEELDWEGDIVKELGADRGTVMGFFKVYEEMEEKPSSIYDLEVEAQKY